MKKIKKLWLILMLSLIGQLSNAQFCPVKIEGTTTLCSYILAAPGQPDVRIMNYDYQHPNYYSVVGYPSGIISPTIVPLNNPQSTTEIWLNMSVNNDVTDVKVSVTYNVPGGCNSTVDYYLYKCCNPNNLPNYWDKTCSSLPRTYNTNGYWQYNNLNIALNGILKINEPSNFQNCTFHMGPGAKIIVETQPPYYAIKFLNCTIEAGCDEMWKGMDITTDCAFTSLNSNFNDAQYAITFNRGIILNLLTSPNNFNRNWIGMYLPDISGNVPPLNTRTVNVQNFELVNFDGTQPMLLPFLGQTPLPANRSGYCGMLLYDAGNFTIPKVPALRNTFTNLNCGIAAYRTNLEVHSSDFRRIDQFGGYTAAFVGSGIFTSNTLHNANSLIVGTTQTPATDNTFYDSFRGAYAADNINSSVVSNTFNAITNEAFYVNNAYFNTVTATGNTMSAVNNGIKIRYSSNETLNLSGNTISSVFPYYNTSFGSTAIQIINKTINPVRGSIYNNTINNCRIGMYFLHVDKDPVYAKLNVYSNPMNFNLPPSLIGQNMHYAMWIDGCNNLNIHDNQNITRSYAISNGPANLDQTMRGIYIRQGHDIDLVQNDITNFGTAIRLQDNCVNTKMKCNNMYSCYQGVFLNDGTTILSAQGDPATGQAWDNKWVNFLNYQRTACAPSTFPPQFSWLHQGTSMPGSANYTIFSPFPSNGTFVNAVPNSTVGPCSNNYVGDDENAMREHVEDVIAENVAYEGTYLAEDEYKDRQAAYEYLSQNENYRNSDANLLAFYNQTLQENIGRFSNVEMLHRAGDYVNALIAANGISFTNLIEQYRRYTTIIALNMDINPDYVLSQTETDELYNIAYTPLYLGGQGVLQARAILGLEVDDQAMSLRVMNPHNTGNTKTSSAATFDGIVLKTLVYDNMGAKALEGIKFTNADLRKALPAGVYIVNTIKQNTSSTKKVSIIK